MKYSQTIFHLAPSTFRHFALCGFFTVFANCLSAAPTEAKKHDLSARASEIDRKAKAHPEIGFLFEKNGKPQDLQHASVDPRIPSQGKLVIWLMAYNKELFARLSSYGFNSIQVHYANGWFGKLYSGQPPEDDLFLSNIRLEAATGKDSSKAVDIPTSDSIMGRAYQFVKWLEKENPEDAIFSFTLSIKSASLCLRTRIAGSTSGSPSHEIHSFLVWNLGAH